MQAIFFLFLWYNTFDMTANDYNYNVLLQGKLSVDALTTLTRLAQAEYGLAIDGKFGPRTRAAVEAAEPPDQQRIPTKKHRVPRNRRDVIEWLGVPDGIRRAPYLESRKGLPSLPPDRYVTGHQFVLDRLQSVLSRTSQNFDRCGGYVYRHIRHDPQRPLSTHSWGIAFDLDPVKNSARRFRRGDCPVPWSDEWYQYWPSGVSFQTVKESLIEGFTWGGVWIAQSHISSFEDSDLRAALSERAKFVTYPDPMHFQWCGV